MTFDAAEYRKRVLTPFKVKRQQELRKALREMQGDPKPTMPTALDLVELYDIAPGVGDAEAAAQVLAVKDVFNKAQSNASFKNIGPTLVLLHRLLAEANPGLSTGAFWAARAGERARRSEEALGGVVRVAVEESQVLRVILDSRLAALAANAQVPVAALAEAVSAGGVRVVAPVAHPPVRIEPALLSEMAKTSCASLVDAIFLEHPPASFGVLDGFRGDRGQRLSASQVEESRQVASRRPSGDDQNAAVGKALGILARLDEEALEHTVLAWFLMAGEAAAEESPALRYALDRLTATRLRPEDAARILAGFSGGRSDRGFPDVERRVQEGALREARRLFQALFAATGGADAEAAGRAQKALAGAEQKVADLRQRAETAAADDDIGSALVALDEALSICADDPSLRQARDGLPPAPPRRVTASPGQDGSTVVVGWDPGTGTTDEIRFTVVCKVGGPPRTVHDGVTVAEGVQGSRFEHRSPQVAEPLHYGVAATRGAHFSPVASQKILVLPPVRGVRATSTPVSVTLTWDTPPQASTVRVEQLSPDGRTTGLHPQAHGGVVSEGLTTGASYTYLVTAVYASAAGDLGAATIRHVATPRGVAVPVKTLRVVPSQSVGDSTVVEASWQHVPGFDVEVWHSAVRLPWPLGARVRAADLTARATRLTGTTRRSGSVEHLSGPVPPGLRHHLAVTRDGDDAVVGSTTEVGVCPPLGPVTCQRFSDVVVLGWDWPGPAFDVDVSWEGQSAGSRRLTRADYEAEGGLRVPTGAGSRIVLRAVPAGRKGQWSSAESVVEVPGAPPAVTYSITWRRWLGRPRSATLRFTCEEQPAGVPVVVVAQVGHVMPRDRSSGTVVAQQTLDLSSGDASLTVQLSKAAKHLWVRAFAEHPDHVHLIDPPAAALRGA